MSSELRHRSKSMHGTTTGLLLKKFQLDSQRSHAIAQARNTSTTRLQVETDGSTDVIQAIINAAPGCYPGDDGSSDIADRYNFFVHRKRFLFAPCSLGIFPESSRFRQALIWCITWKRFDQFILFLILANSTILAIADYSKVDDQGDLDSSQSTRNAIVNSADRIFTILFAVECMKKLVSALLKSIPELLTVVAFLCFLFFLESRMDRGLSARMKTLSERSLRTSSHVAPTDNSKSNDLRRQSIVRDEQDEQEEEEEVPHLHTQDKRGWSYFTQRNSVLRTYQKRLVFNNDIKVATLEFAIMIMSVAQLQWSYRSPYWDYFLRYGLELAYTAIFPYPGLETFLPALRGDTFVALSISVFLRTISWGQWLYYPYPIRQKEKVASFSGNLDAMFFSVVIKKFSFSTMESRVHAFLYRMELYKKKDVSAVMALQATFRYIKSYRHSLVWHQERGCTTFYRPLSDRLPNEVKKKLYASRFQTSLKQIMKYNMDGDPLNAFSKHVEVITAGLGATFADMLRLKKMYNRRARVLEQRKQQANRRTSSVCMTSIDSKTGLGGVSTAWSDEMQRKCEATMLVLKRMETNMKDIQL
ncbi:hypothetical protein JG687_00006278 [Phytophthora cactorum]|uniref:Ion transport domain-containing protein n=1 Tax=Phytophthora cactorum TaxID=29920 RepID=A0A8T1UID2_9STRA|nr:hypothetical protein JG687_00006278 [Phytophthora cactorum]